MVHDPSTGIDDPDAPASEGQEAGAREPAPDIDELKAQLLDEFMEKCGPYRTAMNRMRGVATDTLFDLYSFIVFNMAPDKNGRVFSPVRHEPPSLIKDVFSVAVPGIKDKDLIDYSIIFNTFKANSARRVIEACEKLGKKKLGRLDIRATTAINDIIKLAREKDRPSLEYVAIKLADMSVKDFIERGFIVVDTPLPDEEIAELSEIVLQLLKVIDKSILAETLANELKKIAIEELKGDKKRAHLAFGLYLKVG